MQNPQTNPAQADTFICHASEDKETMARPLHKALTDLGLHAWLDESDIPWGESIRQKIDTGLSQCRSATVILSRIFFSKYWTQYELDGIFQRKMQDGLPFFPIQHGITIEEIRNHSPALAGINLLNSNDHTVEQIAELMSQRLGGPQAQVPSTPSPPQAASAVSTHSFGVIYIAPAGTSPLPEGTEPNQDRLLFGTEHQGWIRLIDSGEELEYVLEADKLRIRLERGGHWSMKELTADQTMSSGRPFSVIIRRAGEPQEYISTAVSLSQTSPFSGRSNPSGWMTFQIQ